MAKDVHVGNDVAVRCESSNDEDFQILLCDKGLHMIQQGYKDGWGQDWLHGYQVNQEIWYETLRPINSHISY
jgi:hypothetical protein